MRTGIGVRRLHYFGISYYPQAASEWLPGPGMGLPTLSSHPLAVCQLTGTSAPKEIIPPTPLPGMRVVAAAAYSDSLREVALTSSGPNLTDRSLAFDPNRLAIPSKGSLGALRLVVLPFWSFDWGG